MPKLTLSIDDQTVDQAKKLARENKTSVSAMFTRFIQSLSSRESTGIRPGPLTRKATGLLSFEGDDYREVLTDTLREKYTLKGRKSPRGK